MRAWMRLRGIPDKEQVTPLEITVGKRDDTIVLTIEVGLTPPRTLDIWCLEAELGTALDSAGPVVERVADDLADLLG